MMLVRVFTEKDQAVSIPSSLEVKVQFHSDKGVWLFSVLTVQGIVGNDNRHYALDLFRIFPPDANYMLISKGAKFRHKMAILRPEFLDTFLR